MSKPVLLFAILFVVLFSLCATAQNQNHPKCPKDYQPYGERCVTQRMADYISCIEASGANHQEITEEVNQAANKQVSGEAKGAGSGVVAKGSGSLVVNATSEKELVRKLQQKWYSDAMKQCANVLGAPRKKPASQGTKDSATGTAQHPGTTDSVTAIPAYHGTTDNVVAQKGPGSVTQIGGQKNTMAVAPNGIAIAGGTVTNPTVNNYNQTPAPRKLSTEELSTLYDFVSRHPAEIMLMYSHGDKEAYDLSAQVRAVLERAGWKIRQHGDFQSFNENGPPASGLTVQYRADAVGPNQRVPLNPETPWGVLTGGLMAVHLENVTVNPGPHSEEGLVWLWINPNPKQ